MIRLDLHFELDYQITAGTGDFLFNIQPARTGAQRVSDECLTLSMDVPWRSETEDGSGNRLIRLRAPTGPLHLTYTASVTIDPVMADPDGIQETPVHALPVDVLRYLMPSRYVESDRLVNLASAEFGHLPPGYARVHAIMEWVRSRITYAITASSTRTTAVETLTERAGVCRDYAHVMIALCRATGLPARYVTGTDYGADPAKAPDFHAYVEVWMDGRWWMFDPSGTGIPMGFVRIGTGRDAADVPFAMLFGEVSAPYAPLVRAVAVEGPGLERPRAVAEALSTDPAGPTGHTRARLPAALAALPAIAAAAPASGGRSPASCGAPSDEEDLIAA